MKKYVKPEMEITEFDVEDVITTSSYQGDETIKDDEQVAPDDGG